jgi:hypothetical protein
MDRGDSRLLKLWIGAEAGPIQELLYPVVIKTNMTDLPWVPIGDDRDPSRVQTS